MALFRHSKTVLVLVLSGLALYLGLVNLLDRLEWKQPSDGILWSYADEGLRVKQLDESNLGLEPGDRLVAINGIPVTNLDDYTTILELLAETLPARSLATYQVEKGESGARERYDVPIELASPVRFTDFLLGLVAFTHLGIGIFIFLRNGRTPGFFHFYLICLVAFVLYLYRHSGRADSFDLLIYWCSAVAFLLLPPLFLHFSCVFPRPATLIEGSPYIRHLIYFPAVFLVGVHVLWFSGGLQPFGLPRTIDTGHLLDRVQLSHFVAFFILAALVFYSSRARAMLAVERQQMKWVTRGTLLGIVPFTLFYAIPYSLGLPVSGYLEAFVLTLIFIPLSFAYALTRYRLMDVELIFKQGAAYALSSSALLVVYLGIVLLVSRAIQGFSPESGFVLFALSALLVGFLFAPVREQVQRQIDRYFYRDQYDYRRSLVDFGRTLSSEVRLSSLSERISNRLQKTLNVAPIALFLRDESHSDRYNLVHSIELAPALGRVESLTIPEAIFSDFDRQLNPLFLFPPSDRVEQAKRQLADWDLHYVQALRVWGRLIGFLALGKRQNGQFLNSEDLELIGILADYASIAIDNALLYHSLENKANELAQLKAYSDNVVESITVGIMAVTPDGEITVWNQSMAEIFGIPTQEATGKKITDIFPRDSIQSLRRLVEGSQWVVEETNHLYKTHLQSRERHDLLVNVTVSPFVLRDDVITGTLFVFDDVTEKVRLENQLLQAEKLSSVGLLAAGIAHEVNTPLTAISSYTQMLVKDVRRTDPRHELLKKIEAQTFRASNIVNNLLNFARLRETDFHEVNLNSLMLQTLSLVDHQFRKAHLEVKLDLDPGLPMTWANGGKLQQVFMNLFLNAKDAMPQGGHLNIRSYCQDSQLVVEVKDSGIGISADDLKRIYDPFFTTKDVGQGTGLGLSVSYGIIQEHSGQISVESQPGKGTTFRVHLPVKRVH